MGHATAEAVLRAGLTLVPYSFTGSSEAVAVGNVGVSGVPVELVHPDERIKCLEVRPAGSRAPRCKLVAAASVQTGRGQRCSAHVAAA